MPAEVKLIRRLDQMLSSSLPSDKVGNRVKAMWLKMKPLTVKVFQKYWKMYTKVPLISPIHCVYVANHTERQVISYGTRLKGSLYSHGVERKIDHSVRLHEKTVFKRFPMGLFREISNDRVQIKICGRNNKIEFRLIFDHQFNEKGRFNDGPNAHHFAHITP